jgi:hypothetical protein
VLVVVTARRERMSLVVGRCMVYFFFSFLGFLFMVGEGKGGCFASFTAIVGKVVNLLLLLS